MLLCSALFLFVSGLLLGCFVTAYIHTWCIFIA